MIRCPKCRSLQAFDISTMSVNRCQDCLEAIFVYYENGILFTSHFVGNTQFVMEAELIPEAGFVEEEERGWFRTKTVKTLKSMCEHCKIEPAEYGLCETCQAVFSIHREVIEGVLGMYERQMKGVR